MGFEVERTMSLCRRKNRCTSVRTLQKTSIPMTKKVVISKENTVDTVDTDTVDTDTEEVDTDMVDTVDMVVEDTVDTVHMVVATDVLVLSTEATEAMEDSEDMAAVTNTVFKNE